MRQNYITTNSGILNGKPIIKGTRMSVELVFEKLANGWSMEDIVEEYPFLNREKINAVMDYARVLVANEDLVYA